MWLLQEKCLQNHSDLKSVIAGGRLCGQVCSDVKSGSTSDHLDALVRVI